MEIIQALTKEGDCWAIYDQTLNAIKTELAKQHGWFFQHVSRVANGDVHRLARLAFVYGEDREWRSDFLICVVDMASISV